MNQRFMLEVEPNSHAVFTKVVDVRTQQVIRTIPPEAWRELAQRYDETLGLLFNETA